MQEKSKEGKKKEKRQKRRSIFKSFFLKGTKKDKGPMIVQRVKKGGRTNHGRVIWHTRFMTHVDKESTMRTNDNMK
jgi:hypothetical protein